MTPVQTWLNGVVGGFIGAAATSVTGIIVGVVWKKILAMALINGIVGSALYLKNSPTPWNGNDRRVNT